MSEFGLQGKWPLVKIAECARIVSGATPKTSEPRYWDGDIRWVTPKDISDLGGYPFLDSTPRTLTAEGLASCSAEILPPRSVLLSSRAPIGLVAINRIPVATNQGFKSFVPDASRLDAGFLYHWLRGNRSFLENLGTGATFKEVSKAVVTRIEIPLPPLDEQKRIAAVLDKADALRRQRQESLQLTEKLLQFVFVDMFGDPVTNAKGWPQASLTKVCKLSSGGTPSKSNTAFWQGTLPWFTPKDLKKNELPDSTDHVSEIVPAKTNLKLYPAETVLIVVRGMILAHTFPVSIIKRSGLVNQDIKALTPIADLHPQFLAACLRAQSSLILTKVTTAGHGTKRLDMGSLSEIQIFLPPRDLQMKFVQIVSCHRELIEDGASSSTHAERLFSSIQQRAFRGELDLHKVKLDQEETLPETTEIEKTETVDGIFHRPGYFPTPPDIAVEMMALEYRLDAGPGDSIPWSENYFKYRILSQVLQAPYSFSDIWDQVYYDMPDAEYDAVKDKVFQYVDEGILEQRFDEERKEIVFQPRL